MSIPKPTIVLFDMDGTTVRHINPKLLGALECLDDLIYKISTFLSKKQKKGSLVDPDAPEGKKGPQILVHRALHKMRRKPVEQIVQPCPGIYALINLLQKHNIPLGIVSNGLGKGYGHDILEKFHLDSHFSSKIFREDLSKSKPHPDPIFKALKPIKNPPEEEDVIWYIGDRHKDISTALAANEALPCRVVPFAYGMNASVAVLEHNLGTDHIILNYLDFTERVRDLMGR